MDKKKAPRTPFISIYGARVLGHQLNAMVLALAICRVSEADEHCVTAHKMQYISLRHSMHPY
jgi:uncharacterized protein with ACT and thioredoxin-like domain